MTGALVIDVLGLGLLGPGLADWAAGAAMLRTPAAWRHAPTAIPAPARLPAAERRRAGAIVKLSVGVADQAVGATGLDPAALATVFSASSGDGTNCHVMCETLATPERLVSPTRFTNSVHNAAAGYWHIAIASRAPSTSLAAHDGGFAAGLLEAAAQCTAAGAPVLLVVADAPYPEPLQAARPIPDAFGVAAVIAPASSSMPGALARWTLRLAGDAPTPCDDAGLEALRAAIPAARALPLLAATARGASDTVVVDWHAGLALAIGTQPR